MTAPGDQSNLGTALFFHRAGQLDRAAQIYREILAHNPNNYDALHCLGLLEAQTGHFDRASSLVARSLELQPANKQIRENYATILVKAGRNDSAIQACNEGLRSDPKNVHLLYLSATALFKLRQLPESLRQFDKLLKVQPNHVIAINERGVVQAEMKEYDQALADFHKAVTLNPKFADAHLNIGNLFGALGRHEEAKSSFEKALQLNPRLSRAWSGLGNILRKHNLFDEALAAFDKALKLEADLAAAWLGRGNVYAELKQYDNAFAAYDRALSLEPDLAEAWFGRGNVHIHFGQYDKAFTAYDRALSLEPDLKYVEGLRLHSKMSLCDWTNIEMEIHNVLSLTRDQKPVTPFVLLPISSSVRDQLRCAKAFVRDQGCFPALWNGEIYSHDRIRIAYLSNDFHEHATAYLMAGLFEKHDKARFEVTAISFGHVQNSDMRQRIAGAVEHFVDVRNESDQQIAELIRQSEIEILIDLKGFTYDARYNVLARRAAPLQVNYLGYPGTMGADFIDYVIADPTIIPKEHFTSYTERVVWLPDSYQVNDWQRRISESGQSRHECCLPEKAFVYCCFNNSYKISPGIFDIWMRLLRNNEHSVLWLFEWRPTTSANLRNEAEKRGVSAERLIFAHQMPLPDHLARYRHVDLFLDTSPYNAHTTASDALWAGAPILTCLGTTFAGRVAGSLLKAIGLDELITHSLEEYEEMAMQLARDPSRLEALRDRLARNRNTYPLFNTERFARHIEAAFLIMWERYQQRMPPEAFAVPT